MKSVANPSENVRVAVRCRPLSKQEQSNGCRSVVNVDESTGVIAVENSPIDNQPAKTFTFDQVFGPDSKQLSVYNSAARPIVENVLQGYNGTIFAYGQTGTGKTFTMEGDRDVAELKGVIPNSFAHIFGHIAKCGEEKTFLVRCSYLEIYNEEVRDLLAKNQQHRLEIKERPDIGVYVKDLSSVTVSSADELDKIMGLGNKNRSVGATNMNEHSSRSHAIFTITLECSQRSKDGASHICVGKLNLIDLAGSERQSKTGATGQRLKEASKINLSLSTLGNVISALVDAKATHVPYRNSKLTRLLQDSLGGNSKTLMIANIGCADFNYDETLSTLRYASRAKNIVNNARINEDPKDALLRKFQTEIELLRKQLAEGDVEDETEFSPTHENIPSKKHKVLSEARIKEIEAEIEHNRSKLIAESNMNNEERRKLELDLQIREGELQKAREEQEALHKKLAQMEKKVIVGGENLLEKMEEQSRLLEESNKELEMRHQKELELRKALQIKQAERFDIEEKYSSLQEEAVGKTKKLKRIWNMLTVSKAELSDLNTEHQREIESLLENVRELSRELSLQMLIISAFIPPDYQELVERYVHWNEESGDWQLKCIAYTGNNMRRPDQYEGIKFSDEMDLLSAYSTYDQFKSENAAKKQTRSGKGHGAKSKEDAKFMSLLS